MRLAGPLLFDLVLILFRFLPSVRAFALNVQKGMQIADCRLQIHYPVSFVPADCLCIQNHTYTLH